MKRREFLSNTTKILCACTMTSGVSLIQSCAENVVMPLEDGEELVLDLNLEEYNVLLQNGGSIVTSSNKIDSRGLLLIRIGESVKAFSNNCTHAGWGLRPFQNGQSTCVSGHGGKFNTDGLAVSSPASGRLKEYSTELNENILTITV